MKVLLWVLFSVVTFSGHGWSQEILRVRTSEWAPHAGDPKDPRPGYCVEILQVIFAAQKITMDYQLTPWKRCVEEVKSGEIDAVLNTDSSTTPGLIFPKTPLGYYQDALIGRSDSAWTFKGMESLDFQQLGVESEYGFDEQFTDYVSKNRHKNVQTFSGEDVVQTGVRMLERKRIDLFFNDVDAFFWTVRKLNLAPEQFKVSHLVGPVGPLYIAFSPKYAHAQKMANLVDAGLAELKSNGRLVALAERYQIKNRF